MPRPKSPVRLEGVDPGICSLAYRLKLIGQLPFFRRLPVSAIAEINRLFADHELKAGRAVYFEGDAATHFYIVSSGKVKLLCQAGPGREVLLDILQAGDYFGNLAMARDRLYLETAIPQTGGCVLQISTEDFQSILSHHPGVTLALLEAVNRRLEAAQEIIRQLSAFSIEQRVAACLLRLAAKMGERQQKGLLIQLPLTRRDLAAITGTTTESVSRTMSRFAEAGLIATGRRWVAVKDIDGLERMLTKAALN